MKILEIIIYVIPQLMFLGAGKLLLEEEKYCRKFSTKFHENRNTSDDTEKNSHSNVLKLLYIFERIVGLQEIGDISCNYKLISTKFSAICLLTRVMSFSSF